MNLRVDWATIASTRYACEHWHYSGCVPAGPSVKVGAWEDGRFIGALIFGLGASKYLGKKYGLAGPECCELTRIALREHVNPVSRIASIAIRMFKRKCPGTRLLVSFADPVQDHYGIIYQAMNWVYAGRSAKKPRYVDRFGKEHHNRVVTASGMAKQFDGFKRCTKKSDCIKTERPGKHRYLFPLDDDVRKTIEPLRKPYPKRQKHRDDAPVHQTGEGGSTPTLALQ